MSIEPAQSTQHNRIDWPAFLQLAPQVVSTLRALTKVIGEAGLEKSLTELVKVRASQLNGCAFCLSLHLDFARKAGVNQQALDLVATWRDTAIFTPRERAALAWTEALTHMALQRPSDAIYQELAGQFSAQEIAFLTASVGLINAWNRIAGGLGFPPAPVTG